MSTVAKVKLWFTGQETSAARLYSRLPRSRHPEKTDEVWLPLSQIEHTTKYPPVPPGPGQPEEWPVHIVTIPDWLIENHNL